MVDAAHRFIETSISRSETALARLGEQLLQTGDGDANALRAIRPAVLYALNSGGKHLRACLVYAAGQAVDPDFIHLDDIACAVEVVHTYSLIHDDLPAIDNDDLRRGKPTLHTAFDEATAILVGDGLQTLAFEILSDASGIGDDQKIRIINVLAQSCGFQGMVGGQYIDITSSGKVLSPVELEVMHLCKTGALIRASIAMAGIAAGATHTQLSALDTYGTAIGLAFQVVDDLLDVEGDSSVLGKTAGKDGEANKPTYVQMLGLEGARNESKRLLAQAIAALGEFGESASQLRHLASYIIERDR
ncbi:MAG: farnesyl diphosphate synthase [Pseudomonadota bacterium]